MSEIILLTGGARSGKSEMAERIALEREAEGGSVLYIATASVCDEEMADRVKKHRERRPPSWKTVERFWNFDKLPEEKEYQSSSILLLDCLGFMLNNIMYESGVYDGPCTIDGMNQVEERMCRELGTLCKLAETFHQTFIAVTNEVGMALVPPDPVSRYYRDILGRANRTVAEQADSVYFLVSGIPMKIK